MPTPSDRDKYKYIVHACSSLVLIQEVQQRKNSYEHCILSTNMHFMIVSFSNLKSFACMDNRFPFHTALSYFLFCVRIFDGKTSFCPLSSIDLQKKKKIFHCFKYISIELESCKFFFLQF